MAEVKPHDSSHNEEKWNAQAKTYSKANLRGLIITAGIFRLRCARRCRLGRCRLGRFLSWCCGIRRCTLCAGCAGCTGCGGRRCSDLFRILDEDGTAVEARLLILSIPEIEVQAIFEAKGQVIQWNGSPIIDPRVLRCVCLTVSVDARRAPLSNIE